MDYQIFHRLNTYTLEHKGEQIGTLKFNPITMFVSGEVKGFGNFSFKSKGYFMWYRLEYSENGIVKCVFRRKFTTLYNNELQLRMDSNEIYLKDTLLCRIDGIPQNPLKLINNKPLFEFSLKSIEFLPFVFGYSAI